MPVFRYVGSAVLQAKAMAALTEAVNLGAEHFVGVAQAETPVDTGTLRASESNEGARGGGLSVTARVSTGGEASEYAFFVHEGTSRMAGRPYLEGPLLNYGPTYRAFITAALEAAF